jgi:hypothetical protein
MTSTVVRGDRLAAAADQLRVAEQMLFAQQQSDHHIAIEITEDIDNIIGTLAEEGPYAYTLMAETLEDGQIRQRLVQSRDGIRESYVDLHDAVGLRKWTSTTQFLSTWYNFHAGWAQVESKTDGQRSDVESLVLFPTMGTTGITGELFWLRATTGGDRREGQSVGELRLELLNDHDAYLDAARAGDVDAMLATTATDAQVGIRDYLSDTPGSMVELDGSAAAADYLRKFLAAYRIERIDVVQRHVEDWYVFAELRWVLTSAADGSRSTFLTADYAEIGPDHKTIARIGHGTEQVQL